MRDGGKDRWLVIDEDHIVIARDCAEVHAKEIAWAHNDIERERWWFWRNRRV